MTKTSQTPRDFCQRLHFVFLKTTKAWFLINAQKGLRNDKHSWSNNFRRKKLELTPQVVIDKLLEREKMYF